MNSSKSEEEWIEQMPESFQVLWNAAKEMGAIDGEIEEEGGGR